MNIFKRKPKKKKTKKPLIKKKPASHKQKSSVPWKPPFQMQGQRSKSGLLNNPVGVQDNSRSILEPPTYLLPPPPENAYFINSASPEPAKKKDPQPPKINESRKAFMKTFNELTRRWRSWDVWTDFVTLVACTISNAVDKSHFEERENMYLRIINKYNKNEQQLFVELFNHTISALEENSEQDFLGSIYTELGLNSKEHRQIFTPYDVARLMAEVTIGDVEQQIKDKGFITIHDCCCGGGVTFIAAMNVIKEKLSKANINFQNHLLVTGQDIDRIVTMMCYIQMSLFGVAGYFKVGDSITDPISENDSSEDYWFTPMYFSTVWTYRRIFRSLDKLFLTEHDKLKGENQ